MSSLDNYKSVFLNRLKKLKNSQASIQSLSLWVLYHYKIGEMLVKTWKEYFMGATSDHYLLLIYLANDVLQNGKRKTTVFSDTFSSILPEIMPKITRLLNEKEKGKVWRVLDLWVEREVFTKDFVTSLKNIQERRRSPVRKVESDEPKTIPPRIEHPIVEALIELEKTKKEGEKEGGIGLDKYEKQVSRFSPLLNVDKIDISQMDLSELKSMKEEYTKHRNDLDLIRNQYQKEAICRTKLSKLLSSELSMQKKLMESNYRPAQQLWNEGYEKVNDFVGRLEISVSAKDIDEENDFSYLGDDNFLSSTVKKKKRKRKISRISGGTKESNDLHRVTKKRKLDDEFKNKDMKGKDDFSSPEALVDKVKDEDVGDDLDGFLKALNEEKM